MWKGSYLWEQIQKQGSLIADAVPAQTIIEIAGDQRVLIENHRGVITYGRENIAVNVKFGSISIYGHNLELTQMTKEQLVIHGRIQEISLQRREKT